MPGHADRRHVHPWHGLANAISFLTVIPTPGSDRPGLTAATGWFPLVGAAAGALAGATRVGAEQLVGRMPATALAMIVLVGITGALHQDGLADTADGLGARGDRTRRMEVMRDSATGAFGTLALIGWALLLFATLASLDGARALIALTISCALGRWAALAHGATLPPGRSDGLGAALQPGRIAVAAATITSLALTLGLCGVRAGAVALGATTLLTALSALCIQRTFGGRTGDTLGATVAITEAAVCVALLAVWHT